MLSDKAQRKLDAAKRKVDGLKKDRDELRVISPRDGVLFYKTTGEDSPVGIVFGGQNQDELEVGGRVSTHSILLTVCFYGKPVRENAGKGKRNPAYEKGTSDNGASRRISFFAA